MTNDPRPLHQITHFLRIQILHYFSHVLCLVAGGDQQSVFRFHHDQVAHAESCHKFSRRVNVISPGLRRKCSLTGNQIVILRTVLADKVFVQCRP